jgi:hypothetical protein
VADLWSSIGTLLATATFTGETASGWQQVTFSQPAAVTAGTTYVASYHTSVGNYAINQNYFTTTYNSGPLQVPASGGVYAYGPAGTFPHSSYASSNYWVDVVLSTGATPTVTSETPASGAPGLALIAPLSTIFNEADQPSYIALTLTRPGNPPSRLTPIGTMSGSIALALTGPGNAAVPAALTYNASTDLATPPGAGSLAGEHAGGKTHKHRRHPSGHHSGTTKNHQKASIFMPTSNIRSHLLLRRRLI